MQEGMQWGQWQLAFKVVCSSWTTLVEVEGKRSLYFYQVKVCLHLKCYLHQLNLTSAYYLNCSLQMEHVLNKHSLIYNQFSMKLIFLLDTLLTYLSKVTFPAALQLLAQINRKIINLQILSRTFRRNWSFVISSP